MGSQEVSKPVMIAVIALAVIIVALMGWSFLKPQKYPGYQAPPGGQGIGGTTAPRIVPGMEPGRMPPGAPR